ncbi:O-antigen polysaccharide polymerase Wzy [Micromonospora sp. URMC 105]|uniref:O-antigen polysaccharide polymerase Wzy n=1 Tax=Micromonospora sp. URMC 105 TaxID=3423413 RepID=UPI003F19639C
MNVTYTVWGAVALGLTAALVLLARSASRDGLGYLILYVAFFGLGPAVNHVLGNEIFSGILPERIPQAVLGVALAIAAMFVVGLVLPARRAAADRARLTEASPPLPLLTLAFWALAAYAVGLLALRGPALLAGDKLLRIDLAGPWHYPYLLLQIFACSTYFMATTSRAGRLAYWTNFACYTTYCLATNERDFIYVAFGLLLHLQLFRTRGVTLRVGVTGALCLLGAAYLTSVRSGQQVGVQQTLNEGSVLTVDTTVMSLVPFMVPHTHGATFWHSLTALVPGLDGVPPALADWFVGQVAAGSGSGYGFTLTGEAYLNFGMLGIPVLFALLAAAARLLMNNVDRGPFTAYLSMLFVVSLMYNIRGESRALIATLVYGLLFYGLLHLIRSRLAPARPAPAGPPASATAAAGQPAPAVATGSRR